MSQIHHSLCCLILSAGSACFGADYFATSFENSAWDRYLEENRQPGIYHAQNGRLLNSRPDILDTVHTKASDYHQRDFVFECGIVVSQPDAPGNNFIVGIGRAAVDRDPSVSLSLRPTSNGVIVLSSSRYGWHWDSGLSAIGTGTHRVRMIHRDGELSFQVDTDCDQHCA